MPASLHPVLLGMLYEDKERQDFIFTIYHWWQALAIFTVYLWSGLPMKVSRAGMKAEGCRGGAGRAAGTVRLSHVLTPAIP